MDSSLFRKLNAIRAELSLTVEWMQKTSEQYLSSLPQSIGLLWSNSPNDPKAATTTYYLFAKELAAHITKADQVLIKLTALMEEADGVMLPSLVKECDGVLERYLLFRNQINENLAKNDQAFLQKDASPSPAWIQKQIRELQSHCKYFLDFLRKETL